MDAAKAALSRLLAFNVSAAPRIQDSIYHLNDMLAQIFSKDSLSGTADRAILCFMSQVEAAEEFMLNYKENAAEAVEAPFAASYYSAARRSIKRIVREVDSFGGEPPGGISEEWWSEFGTVANEAFILLNVALALPATREVDVVILHDALDFIYNNTNNIDRKVDASFGKTLLCDCMGGEPLSAKRGFYGIIQTVHAYIYRYEP